MDTTTDTTSETTSTAQDAGREAPQPVTEVADTAATTADESPEMFSAQYVRELRKENAEARVRAKLADSANDRLLAAYVNHDGRLIDPDLITVSDEVLGEDGLIDAAKVTERIDALLTAKPQYAKVKPATIPQGVREEAPVERGLFSLIRERM